MFGTGLSDTLLSSQGTSAHRHRCPTRGTVPEATHLTYPTSFAPSTSSSDLDQRTARVSRPPQQHQVPWCRSSGGRSDSPADPATSRGDPPVALSFNNIHEAATARKSPRASLASPPVPAGQRLIGAALPHISWQSERVPATSDALLNLLHPAWQALIAGCLFLVTVLGLGRLAARGPTRMNNAVLVTGALIIAVTAGGLLAVSCSAPTSGSPGSSMMTPRQPTR